jgi:hypothetical protein
MYSPALIATHEDHLLRIPAFRALFPEGIPHYSIDDSRAIAAQIEQARDEKGSPTRRWTPDEQRFVGATQLRVMYDGRYFLEAFYQIDHDGHGLRYLYPLWESQTFVLDRLGDLELQRLRDHSPDGLLVNILKVRQVGITTLGVGLITHRLLTQPHVRGLLGADIESQAAYMFKMAERAYANLPSFLKPARTGYNKDREMLFSNASSVRTAWGKTTRGALQEVGGTKGALERGRTHSVWHIGELATWDHPEQLDTAFFPGVPISPAVLGVLESTAEIADDWWHKHWEATKAGFGRFENIFIPNYAVPSKYSIPAPDHWAPNESTKSWIQKAERESPIWFMGRTLHPTRDQAYWYESTRAYFEKKNDLHGFLREYPSDDIENFQYAGTQIFTHAQHERLERQARPLLDVWAVEPSREIAELKRIQPETEHDDPTRRPVPFSHRVPRQATIDQFPVPPGYGFRRVPKGELQVLLSTGLGLRQSVLAIYEYPRTRGKRRYVLGVDVGYGLGKDYSVITVARTPTIEEPAEEVAQYVSHLVTPTQLAWVCDAVGHLYVDEEGVEALAAIECNLGPGLSTQDTLQLHLGYTHFYTWEYANARDPDRRFSTRIGWYTTQQTRPILLSTFYEAVTQVDEIAAVTDYCVNSSVTRQELRHLVIPPGGTVGQAEAASSHHDDAVLSSAIAYYVAYRLAGGEAEPIADRRKRRDALTAYHATLGVSSPRRDWRNSDIESDRIPTGTLDGRDTDDDESPLHFDPRTTE